MTTVRDPFPPGAGYAARCRIVADAFRAGMPAEAICARYRLLDGTLLAILDDARIHVGAGPLAATRRAA